MKNFFLIPLLFSVLIARSQTGGEAVYSFLNLPTSARQIALGGSALTISGDINQPMWNPATIDSDLNNLAALNYTNFLAGIKLGSFMYATRFHKKLGVFHSSVKYLDYGTLTRADESGNITGSFKAYDLAVSLGYAHHIKSLNLDVGANVKIINSLIDTFSSVGMAMDLAFMYKDIYSPFKISLVFRNIGTQLKTFNGTNEKIPLQISLGASSQLEHVPIKWFVSIDNLQQWDISTANPSNATYDIESDSFEEEEISFGNNAMRHFVFGVELFPDSKLTFRLGYNHRKAKELSIIDKRTSSGLSYGFGLKIPHGQLNYALSKFHPSANSNTFSLILDLN
ncbi:type IX secretion system protein PorQ [Flavicella sediminum]|uniref:type IX secretion system protein PorQ n=1 Tax=Flavicella sediminum TaxID=2585141 RepID=UPI001123111F|nr:type IX secretion system protein PorQ [Flavicella sediminum]